MKPADPCAHMDVSILKQPVSTVPVLHNSSEADWTGTQGLVHITALGEVRDGLHSSKPLSPTKTTLNHLLG